MKLRQYITTCAALSLAGILGLTGCGGTVSDNVANMEATENANYEQKEAKTEESGTAGDQEETTWNDYAVDKLDRSDEGYVLVWSDELDGDSLDETKWSCQHGTGEDYGLKNWGNGEQQNYTNREENVRVEDGQLIITALREDYESSSYTSARIRTVTDNDESLFTFTYGRVEAKIKVDGGSGVWPAFWLLPADKSIYGEWAASGELDIMEAKGRTPGVIGGTAHFGETWPNNTYSSKEYVFKEGNGISDYHTYAIEWEPGCIRWYVDDECYSTLTDWFSNGAAKGADYTAPAPFDVPFYIILNLALGGSYDPQGVVTEKSFPAQMCVDFVRVFQKEGGYEEEIKAAMDAKSDNFDYDATKRPLAGKYLVYNGTFDQGRNRLAFWHTEDMDAEVSSCIDADAYGNGDYTREAVLIPTSADAKLYQTGIQLEEEKPYGIRCTISAEEETDLIISVTGSNGESLFEQSTTVPAGIYRRPVSFKFLSTMTDEMATITFALPNGGSITLDDVIMMNIE